MDETAIKFRREVWFNPPNDPTVVDNNDMDYAVILCSV